MNQLQTKLEMNSERRIREQMLRELPEGIQSILQNSKARHSRVLFSSLEKSPFPNFEDGVLVTKNSYELYWHVEFDRIMHIKRLLNESNIKFYGPVALHLGKGPVYLINGNFDVDDIVQLSDCMTNALIDHIFIVDRLQGLIIDSYCGYLPDERSTTQEEVVYEFTYYKDAEQGGALDALTRASDL